MGWPASHRVISSTGLAVVMAYWWCDGRSTGLAQLNRLISTQGPPAQWFGDRLGRINVLGTTWVSDDTTATVSVPRLRPRPTTENDLADVVNLAETQLTSYNERTQRVLWERGVAEDVSTGETRFRAEFLDPVTSLVTPALNTDYSLNQSGGVTITLENQTSHAVDVVITATATRTISGLQLRGRDLEIAGRTALDDSDPDSARTHGDRPWRGNPWPTLTRFELQNLVSAVVDAYSEGVNSREVELLVNDNSVYDAYSGMGPLTPVSVADPGGLGYDGRIRSIRWLWHDTRLVADVIVDQDGGLLTGGEGPFILGSSMLG